MTLTGKQTVLGVGKLPRDAGGSTVGAAVDVARCGEGVAGTRCTDAVGEIGRLHGNIFSGSTGCTATLVSALVAV